MKKILMILMSSVLAFTVVFVNPQNEADAFISKLMGLSAKKIAKEVVKDIAVESAANFAINEAFKIADAQMQKYNQQEAYKIVCLYRMTGEVCDKPIAIKENLTEADKISISRQAEIELDKMVSPEGKGFTKWQKFMDWFGPVWITSAIMSVITYAIDSDVRSMFNEIGYNALVALGFIKPVVDNSAGYQVTDPITQEERESSTPVQTGYNYNPTTSFNNTTSILKGYWTNPTYQNEVFEVYFPDAENMPLFERQSYVVYNNDSLFITPVSLNFDGKYFDRPQMVVMQKNGVTIQSGQPSNTTIPKFFMSDTSILQEQMRSILYRVPYQVNGVWYSDVLFNTVDGDSIHFQTTHGATGFKAYLNQKGTASKTTFAAVTNAPVIDTLYKDKTSSKTILTPLFDENVTDLDLMENSSYEKDGQIALVPPVAIPYFDLEGEPLTITPNPSPNGEPVFTRPDGTTVPEEEVQLGDPVVTPSPDGTPQVTPTPTEGNPAPEPLPLVPTPPTSPPTTGGNPPPEDGGGGKPILPLALFLGLFKLLTAIIFYLIRMFLFIATIQFIPPIPIPNPYFIWFTTVEILGIQPYPLVKNLALFFLSFSIYKSIRRVFG